MKRATVFFIALLCISNSLCMDLAVDVLTPDAGFYSFGLTTIKDNKAYFLALTSNAIWEYNPSNDEVTKLNIDATNIYQYVWMGDQIVFTYGSTPGTVAVFDPDTEETTDILTGDTNVHSLVAYDDNNVCVCHLPATKAATGPKFSCYDAGAGQWEVVSDTGLFCTNSAVYSAVKLDEDIYITMIDTVTNNVGYELYRYSWNSGVWNNVADLVGGAGSSTPKYTFIFQDNIFVNMDDSGNKFLVRYDPVNDEITKYPTEISNDVTHHIEFNGRLYMGVSQDFSNHYLASISLDSTDLEIMTEVRCYSFVDFDGTLLMIGYPAGTFTGTVFKIDVETNTTEVVNIINDDWSAPNVNGDLFIHVSNKFIIQDYNMDYAPDLGRLFGWKGQDSAPGGNDDKDDDSGLSDGAIAGIVIGVVVGTACCCFLIIFCLWRRRKNNKVEHQNNTK